MARLIGRLLRLLLITISHEFSGNPLGYVE